MLKRCLGILILACSLLSLPACSQQGNGNELKVNYGDRIEDVSGQLRELSRTGEGDVVFASEEEFVLCDKTAPVTLGFKNGKLKTRKADFTEVLGPDSIEEAVKELSGIYQSKPISDEVEGESENLTYYLWNTTPRNKEDLFLVIQLSVRHDGDEVSSITLSRTAMLEEDFFVDPEKAGTTLRG